MTSPQGEHSPPPDTDVEPVTLDRVCDILLNDGIEYSTEEVEDTSGNPRTVVRTGYQNAAIAFALEEERLVCDSLWRGQVPLDSAAPLMAAVNQWNETQFTPTLRFFEQQGSHLVVSAYRQIRSAEGLSRNQLGAFSLSSLEATAAAFSFIEEQFPALVSWRYTP
ncbi:YbjN domain-containing protein [Corynebacterium tapiri]|uniref:YbjN domain-containing protein n=1 Tax=Corynebacterium tapiri TaxID=1448266 RepID=A0A5C4U484_9CORY|nr:YbjN domain-containing protein [Corynebacterium tapiri]TNL97780.1 YbjN domain-containing protein [Corynebacterium tapiri]